MAQCEANVYPCLFIYMYTDTVRIDFTALETIPRPGVLLLLAILSKGLFKGLALVMHCIQQRPDMMPPCANGPDGLHGGGLSGVLIGVVFLGHVKLLHLHRAMATAHHDLSPSFIQTKAIDSIVFRLNFLSFVTFVTFLFRLFR